jgi:hypothetical protein
MVYREQIPISSRGLKAPHLVMKTFRWVFQMASAVSRTLSLLSELNPLFP